MIQCIYSHPVTRQYNTGAPPPSLPDLPSNISVLLTARIAALQHRSLLTSVEHETRRDLQASIRAVVSILMHICNSPGQETGSFFPPNVVWLWMRPPRELTRQKGVIFAAHRKNSKEEFLLLYPRHKPRCRGKGAPDLILLFSFSFLLGARLWANWGKQI